MKRLIVCCDGTWDNADEVVGSSWFSPSNVVLLSRSIKQLTEVKNPGTEQIVFYQAGVASNFGALMRTVLGAVGGGIRENVREAYAFIAHNWSPGDEIYLFGFSRGAYTARSVSGLICEFGLLTKRGMDGIGYVLDAYLENGLDDSKITELSAKYERSAAVVPIKFVGVWETVGSLGIPNVYLYNWKITWLDYYLNQYDIQYQLSDTNVHPNVEFAFHAVALNELRAPFTPTLWKLSKDNKTTTMKQVWFPGAHGLGGNDTSHGLSDIALAWMVQQLTTHTDLECNIQYLLDSRKAFGINKMDTPWGCEPWDSPFKGYMKVFGGRMSRTPGKYLSPQEKDQFVTNEYYHKCVTERIKILGDAYDHPPLDGLEEDVFGEIEKKLSW